jgi:uncharacterized protein YdaU (DUF1376 family)
MNFYKRHIGDYIKKAGHLTLLEHGIYARLMDVYYTREAGIPEDKAARLIGARTKEEVQALSNVLDEFFTLVDGVWTQGRCEEEIGIASAKAEKNRENGSKGGRPRKSASENKPNENPNGFDFENHVGSEKNLSQTPDSRLQTKTYGSGASTQPELGDDDRLPPRPQHPPVSPDMRAVAIATLLTGAGVKKVTAFHPDVAVTWAQDERVTDELLLAAVARAKESLGDEPFQSGYLRPIIVELLNPPAPKAPKANPDADWAWKKSTTATDAKGRELGMFARGGESYDDFRNRIQAELDKRKGRAA